VKLIEARLLKAVYRDDNFMKGHSASPSSIMDTIHDRLGERLDEYFIPPPAFVTMHGEILAFDAESGVLATRFPVLEKHLNAYGSMQGGMVAAAVDNTLHPLSMMLAPPSVTRRLQMKYSRPVTPDLEYITVKGRLLKRRGQWLEFSAEVRDQDGVLLARARAVHWVVGDPEVLHRSSVGSADCRGRPHPTSEGIGTGTQSGTGELAEVIINQERLFDD
jgi:acyl-coenzyme A thioesterase PaaI-like protein